MGAKVFGIGLLGTAWALGLVLPHFQMDPNFDALLLDSAVVPLLAFSLWLVLNNAFLNSLRVSFLLTTFSAVLFLLGYLLLKLGQPFLYNLWAHMGSGGMEYEGNLIPFGDLVHLSAAAACSTRIEIGQSSCDPWQRVFNQNPDLLNFLNLFKTINIDFLGIGSYVLLTLLLVLLVWQRNLTSISFVIFIFSPPYMLAVERGNEIITTLLVVLSFITLESKNKYIKVLSVFFLFAAVIFKLWPIILVILLALFSNRTNRIYVLSALIFSVGYWVKKIHEIPEMLSATQHGSPYGVSFGFKLFFSDQISSTHVGFLLALAVVIASVWICFFSRSLSTFMRSWPLDGKFAELVPLLLTYTGVWVFSDSFMYRMLILLPALLYLINKDLFDQPWVKSLIILILATVLSSRLTITTAMSSALALVCLFISCVYAWARIRNHISRKQVW